MAASKKGSENGTGGGGGRAMERAPEPLFSTIGRIYIVRKHGHGEPDAIAAANALNGLVDGRCLERAAPGTRKACRRHGPMYHGPPRIATRPRQIDLAHVE